MKKGIIILMFLISTSSTYAVTVRDDYHVNNAGANSYTVMDDQSLNGNATLNNNQNYNQNSNANINGNSNSNNNSANASNVNNIGGGNGFSGLPPAPPATAPTMIGMPGSDSFSGGVSTPFGGVSFGKATTIPEARRILNAQATTIDIQNLQAAESLDPVQRLRIIKHIMRKYR